MLKSERNPWEREEREEYPFEDMEKLGLPRRSWK
jgi:hypothetical protein